MLKSRLSKYPRGLIRVRFSNLASIFYIRPLIQAQPQVQALCSTTPRDFWWRGDIWMVGYVRRCLDWRSSGGICSDPCLRRRQKRSDGLVWTRILTHGRLWKQAEPMGRLRSWSLVIGFRSCLPPQRSQDKILRCGWLVSLSRPNFGLSSTWDVTWTFVSGPVMGGTHKRITTPERYGGISCWFRYRKSSCKANQRPEWDLNGAQCFKVRFDD